MRLVSHGYGTSYSIFWLWSYCRLNIHHFFYIKYIIQTTDLYDSFHYTTSLPRLLLKIKWNTFKQWKSIEYKQFKMYDSASPRNCLGNDRKAWSIQIRIEDSISSAAITYLLSIPRRDVLTGLFMRSHSLYLGIQPRQELLDS